MIPGWVMLMLQGDETPRNMIDDILCGQRSAELFLNFLNKNNKTDMSILKVTKVSISPLYSAPF